jgi:hypothetical protein
MASDTWVNHHSFSWVTLGALCEASMAHTLTAWFDQASERRQLFRRTPADDPLGVARGIAFGVLASILLFWLPLAFLLSG